MWSSHLKLISMKILIVEDQEAKAAELLDFVFTAMETSADLAKSFIEARDLLSANSYDWVVLDMTIPFEGGQDVGLEQDIEALGGRLLLREAKVQGWSAKIVIVTQYPTFDPGGERITIEDLKREAEQNFPDNYKGIVFYRRGLSHWKGELEDILRS